VPGATGTHRREPELTARFSRRRVDRDEAWIACVPGVSARTRAARLSLLGTIFRHRTVLFPLILLRTGNSLPFGSTLLPDSDPVARLEDDELSFQALAGEASDGVKNHPIKRRGRDLIRDSSDDDSWVGPQREAAHIPEIGVPGDQNEPVRVGVSHDLGVRLASEPHVPDIDSLVACGANDPCERTWRVLVHEEPVHRLTDWNRSSPSA